MAGKVVIRPALADPELIDFAGVGTLEAFATDGLRTLLRLRDIPEMVEKTLRYPGHRELMLALRESGFLGLEPIAVGAVSVVPRELVARLLFPLWQLEDGEDELTVMRLEVEGRTGDGRRLRVRYELLDRFDRATGTTSMARTTGYTATAMVRLLAAGHYRAPGIAPPELVGRKPGCFRFLLDDLAERGVVLRESIEELGNEVTARS
jgi:saccharopine dehydrogenase-like NADP-dependent oxidoreductase